MIIRHLPNLNPNPNYPRYVTIFHNFHEHEMFEKGLNSTSIALIPKKIGQLEVKDFRPINLAGKCV
jgi:hypothetical protein